MGVWSRGEEELGNSGASSCTDLRKHPPRFHNAMMSRGRRGVVGIYNRGSRVRKAQMRAHGQTPTQGKDNVTHSASCEGGTSCTVCVCVDA